jgi:hypothetical protein
MKIPFKCPICGGTGLVPNGFYNNINGGFPYSSTSTLPETCRGCVNGIIWGSDCNDESYFNFQFELIPFDEKPEPIISCETCDHFKLATVSCDTVCKHYSAWVKNKNL